MAFSEKFSANNFALSDAEDNTSTPFNRGRITECIHPMEHISNNHKDLPNHHKNSHKLCDETGHPVVNLMESQWKLRQQHDQNFSMEGKPL